MLLLGKIVCKGSVQHKHWNQPGSSTAPRTLGNAEQTSGDVLHGPISCLSRFVRGDDTKTSYAAKFTPEAAEKHLSHCGIWAFIFFLH